MVLLDPFAIDVHVARKANPFFFTVVKTELLAKRFEDSIILGSFEKEEIQSALISGPAAEVVND